MNKMLKKGYSVNFKDNMCIIYDHHGCEIANVGMIDDSFPLDFSMAKQHVYSTKADETWLWHRRFGHYSLKSLKFMKDNDMVMDMSAIYVSDDVCECCQKGKMHRKAFPVNKAWRATHKLELVHTNISGPMSIPSLNGSKYFLLFIDDFTRMVWVYFMANKSEVFSIFKKFKAYVENQSECRIKTLRSDNGMEYKSGEFVKFCEVVGINQ